MIKNAEEPSKEEYDFWIIELKENGELVRETGFIPKKIENEYYIELNYYIAKAKWGNGYATEIGRALLKYAFEMKKIKIVVTIIDPKNTSSQSYYKNIKI